MTRPLLTLLLALAPADMARGGSATPPAAEPAPVAEIVTFRLAPGIADPAFLEAARATVGLLAAEPGFLSRRLSRGTDGRWTDHVLWTDIPEAEAAAARILSDPAAMPFLMAIDAASIVMRHERMLLTME